MRDGGWAAGSVICTSSHKESSPDQEQEGARVGFTQLNSLPLACTDQSINCTRKNKIIISQGALAWLLKLPLQKVMLYCGRDSNTWTQCLFSIPVLCPSQMHWNKSSFCNLSFQVQYLWFLYGMKSFLRNLETWNPEIWEHYIKKYFQHLQTWSFQTTADRLPCHLYAVFSDFMFEIFDLSLCNQIIIL